MSSNANRHRRWVEHLEERNLLSASPWVIATSAPFPEYDPGEQSLAAGSALPVSPFPVEQTFFLHSNPGAEKVIYLDFDGHITQFTPWNGDPEDPTTYIPTIVTPPFSMDGDGQFTNQELVRIQRIWERVAEDFRPFNVNVTTEDPGSEAISAGGTRVAIGGSTSDWFSPPNDPAGGVAFIGSFGGGSDLPCFVFSGGGSEKFTAEAASHEVGHTLGLGHDGQVVPGEEEPIEYYPGHGMGIGSPTGWAPIMGNSYSQEVSHWSIGEYPNANNLQDDLETITTNNGFDYRDDEHGNDIDSATPLEPTSTTFFGEGIIERNTDLDFFSFNLGIEQIIFDIRPFQTSPNLDILATLYNSAGIEIASSNPVASLGATFRINTSDASLLLQPGRYYISIDGTGKPFTTDPGYSDYASLGYFSISGTRTQFLAPLVGVDFDILGGVTPLNWTRYSGGNGATVLSDLRNEAGVTTSINLQISSSKGTITTATNTIDPTTLALHPEPLTELGGYIADSNVEWTFQWTDLEPLKVYEVYVFGASGLAGGNSVQIVGLNGILNFDQTLSANSLEINGAAGSDSRQLVEYAYSIKSTVEGTIQITVSNQAGMAAGLAGLAIRRSTLGEISGQKWNDLDGNGIKDEGEPGLPGWTIYLDANGNGVRDIDFPQMVASVDVPQPISDNTTVKSVLLFQGIAQISDVNVSLDIDHTFDADLDVYLISPQGTRVLLFSDVGGNANNFRNTILDDEAAFSIDANPAHPSAVAPFTGSFRPASFKSASDVQSSLLGLSSLDGEDPNGIWTLEITDDSNNDTGVLNSWSITILGSEIFKVTDENGNYSFDGLTAGIYRVEEDLQGQLGWVQRFAPPPVTLISGARFTGVDFGNWIPVELPSSIGGQKWNDVDGDGEKDTDEVGLAGWTIFIDGNGNGILDPSVTSTVNSTDVIKAITNFSTVTSQILFEGLSSIDDVNITLDITHTFVGDLEVYLISPTGRQVELFTGIGGQFNNFQNTTLDDQAATSISNGMAPFAGSYRPEGLLSDFIGDNPNGVWQLLIRDIALGDEGILNSWSLTIAGSEQSAVTDENGFYVFENLSEGTYRIAEQQKPGWVQTAPIIPTDKAYWDITLAVSEDLTGVDFGNKQVQLLPGDYNLDGEVDTSDFIVWRFTMGSSVTPFTGADGDGSGVIDQADYDLWRANFGQSLSSGASSLAVTTSDDPSPSLASATVLEAPVLQSVEVQPAAASTAAVAVTQFQPAATRSADQGGRETASGSTEVPATKLSRSTPSASSRFTGASRPSENTSSDAAILAWLSGRTGRDRISRLVDHGMETGEESFDGEHGNLCDSVDDVFAAMGAAWRS